MPQNENLELLQNICDYDLQGMQNLVSTLEHALLLEFGKQRVPGLKKHKLHLVCCIIRYWMH